MKNRKMKILYNQYAYTKNSLKIKIQIICGFTGSKSEVKSYINRSNFINYLLCLKIIL
jgi:hypothetical protein